MRLSRLVCAALVALIPVAARFSDALAQTSNGIILPSVEWEKRIAVDAGLASSDAGLLGDRFDRNSGSLTFEHTDVSLPGNSSLEVAVRRRRDQGDNYPHTAAHEFGDWQISTPRIKVTIPASSNWAGNRCSGNFSSSLPPQVVLTGSPYLGTPYTVDSVRNHQYSNGVILDVGDAGAQQILESPVGAHWPAVTSKVTSFGWHLTCIAEIGAANGGGEGFYATAPNGNRYRFDRLTYRDSTRLETIPHNAGSLIRKNAILLATEVTDVNGNWVRYAYDSSARLTSIQSNDGRLINITYSGSSGLINTIIANPGGQGQRVWTYQYGSGVVPVYDDGLALTYPNILKSVALPDGRSWMFDISGMSVRPPLAGGGCSHPGAQTLTVTHPDGVVGAFTLAPQIHRIWNLAGTVPGRCFGDPPHRTDRPIVYISYMEAMSVTRKTLSGPGIPTATWIYQYEGDASNVQEAANLRTNWTRVTDPSGVITTYFHRWENEPLGGKLIREEVRQGSPTSTPTQITDYTYVQEGSVGGTFMVIVGGLDLPRLTAPTHVATTTITRDGDTYTTANVYDSNFSSSTYSFGFPTRVTETSSTAPGLSRVADTVYAHNKTKWALGLPSTVTRNGKLFDSFTYDTLGRTLTRSQFGVLRQTFTYNADGTVATFKDAHNHLWTLAGWKRGQPQSVVRPNGLGTFSRVVDDNGWVTSETDARSITTGFGYTSMGWLTLVDRPAPFNDSTFAYSGLGGGVTQTEIRGARMTTTSYDGMLRPYLVRTAATDGSAATISEVTNFDIFGRVTFKSWPSTQSSYPQTGVLTNYDALSRPISSYENVPPYATTTTQYLSGGLTRVTDPSGAVVTTTARAFGSPDEAEPMSILDAMGTTTTFTRDIYGNVTTLSQSGTTPVAASVTRQFWYDASLRLCRHRAPEFGDEVFLYDSEGQLIQSGRGQAAASGCVTSIGTAIRVTRGYDSLHRETSLSFPSGTPGVTRSYDGNSNVTNVTRTGGAVWTYTFTALDALASEQLAIDGRSYVIGHGYNANGDLASRSNGHSGVTFAFNPDAFGRARGASVGTTNYISGATYHPNGLLDDATYLNGQVFDQTLDARQLPDQLKTAKPGGATAVWLTHAYDARRKLSSVADLDGAGDNEGRSFTYDANGRLLTANGPWGSGSYVYDALGNIRNRTEGTSSVSTMNYNASNRVSTATIFGQSRTFSYDARGNVTNNGRYAFAYDFANQPVSQSGAVNATYAYDGNFKRVKEVRGGKTIYNVYSRLTGALLYRDQATDVVKTDYVNVGGAALRLKKTGTGPLVAEYTHFDLQGSAVAASDASGAVLWRESYRPYGRTRLDPPANANDAGYTGHLRDDATGLNYMQARYYDPAIGRFYSTDPIGYQDQLNLYAYVHNDPINLVDPNGESAKLIRPLIKTIRNGGDVRQALLDTGLEVADALSVIANPGSSPFERATAVFDVLSPVSAKELSKADRLLKNQLQGAFGERARRSQLGDRIRGEQISIKSADGKTTAQFDFVTKDGALDDAKTGSASFSKNQQVIADDVAAGRSVTPVGRNAEKAGFEREPVKFLTCSASRIDTGC